MTLDEALDEISIEPIVEEHYIPHMSGWYPVSDKLGICAYFPTETQACAYRLFLINVLLNGDELLNAMR